MNAFLGMRGSSDWVTGQRPKNWREAILYLYPNGSAPLTAMLSLMRKESTDDPEYNWWTKRLPIQGGDVTNIYTDVALSSAYTSGGNENEVIYVKAAEAVIEEFRIGMNCLLRDASDYSVDVNAEVKAVVKNGASSYLAVKLLEDDDNSSLGDLSDCDRVLGIGNANEEGADTPDGMNYDPTKYYNFTQIFRDAYEITRTASKQKLRTGDQLKENRREALELHSIGMEKAFLWGIRTEKASASGKKKRTTWGMVPMIVGNTTSDNIDSYKTNSSYSGKTWLEGGEDWLDDILAKIFRFGSMEKLAYCGYAALGGLNKLAKTYGNINLVPNAGVYGIKIIEWVTPHGVLYLKTHPLMSYEATNINTMIIFEPKNVKYRYIDDTKLKKNVQGNGVDGQIDEFLTEAGLEFHHPDTFGYLNGVGEDNAV